MPLINKTIIYFFTALLWSSMISCGSEEDKKVSVYEDVKFAASEFLINITYKNFKRAELFCDNASKSSVRKLKNFENDYLAIIFKEIDTCTITKNNAECTCLFENGIGDEIKQTIQLKKYQEEWLVNFVLEENFDNIYVYEFDNLPFEEGEKWQHQELHFEAREYLVGYIASLNSNKLVIDHTPSFDLNKVDQNIHNNSIYLLESSVDFGFLNISNTYELSSAVVTEVTSALSVNANEDIKKYYKDIVSVLSKELGRPYNLKKDIKENDFFKYQSLRWFIKGYNEILELRYVNSEVLIKLHSAI